MFKNLVFTLALSLCVLTVYAQHENTSQRVKYITKAPDGSTSMIIYDDSRSNTLELASSHDFYKYQLIDTKTGEPIYAFNHKGKTAVLHKSAIAEGDYELRVYTKQFIVTSFITIAHKEYFLRSEEMIAASGN